MKKILFFIILYVGAITALIQADKINNSRSFENANTHTASKRERLSGPAEFAKFHWQIRTAEGESKPGYRAGYKISALSKAKQQVQAVNARTKTDNGVTAWTERGPSNVPGRTRGLIVDPDDATRNTWFAGSAGGGVWKTTNGGTNWTLLTPDLPNLATTVLAMANSNRNTIYMGTGEGFFNLDAISGGGIFKSTDRGNTWSSLSSTIYFSDINRLAVSPTNENVVIAATRSGIYRTSDGGVNWLKVLDEVNVQDIKVNPSNFNIQYAAQNSVGVWKSIDAGQTWTLSNNGIGNVARVELAVSPVNNNRIFASAETSFGGGSKLLLSDDAGANWNQVNVVFNNEAVDFLGGQGWYDNTIVCDPFNANVIYFGGVGIFRLTLSGGSSTIANYYGEEIGTEDIFTLTRFASANFNNGTLVVGSGANISVEVRFGAGKTQKAHRFMVPVGATSGVTDANYAYQDYINVPFEVWDITNNRQLMISFRDQGRDGAFNLIPSNTTSTVATEQSREYLFIHNITYNNATPNASIAVAGGHIFNQFYNFWPTLAEGATWNPNALPTATFRINFENRPLFNATTTTVADVYNEYDGKNRFVTFGEDVHPDQHNLVAITTSASTFRLLNANDGGIFISNSSSSPGTTEGSWTMVGNTYNTSQFYGADKRPGFNEYVGGMQDNGTWKSPAGANSTAATQYLFNIGGDGFEVLWNNRDDNLIIGGSQFNGFRRSSNGGTTWTNATTGLSGDAPFISKLANSRALPDRIFAVGSSGVFVSNDFGLNWSLTPITQKWVEDSFMDIEVSRANANIVWAGTGMTSDLNLHVSTNGGASFTVTNNFADVSMGGITKLASHPSEENTAYALFSFSGKPKILKTTDLGVTWSDISGFGTNNTSNRGFPDVAVYCLYVRPDNNNIIWAGTEIGIVESLDGGNSWNIIEDFPNVSVWDMKGVDDQVVIATHGRGIWTATISAPQTELPPLPEFVALGTSPSGKLAVKITSEEAFQSLDIVVDNVNIGTVDDLTAGETIIEISGATFGNRRVSGIAYIGTSPFITNSITGQYLELKTLANKHSNYFSDDTDFRLVGFQPRTFSNQTPGTRNTLHSAHPYLANASNTATLLVPITVASSNAFFKYRDVAIIEPNDQVTVEATLNGIDWFSIITPYNAAANSTWTNTLNSSGEGTYSQMVAHEIDLSDYFNAGDKVLFRFKLTSNASLQGWGWAIDYVAIQEEPTAVIESATINTAYVFPNPSTSQTSLQYTLQKKSDVNISVVNTLGMRLNTIDKKGVNPGSYAEAIDLTTLTPGTYFIIIKKEDGNETVRLVKN
ncbi:MAG: T9SS C-terminal target domain-containing protein [Cytophagia bacterium]|nr:T9SS C-terminal target domain-containing protein [Cytophagia bacterium]